MRQPIALFFASLVLASSASAETLGRLFLTPAQRQALDRQRQQNPWFVPDQHENLEINGEIRQHSQAKTRWINGQATADNLRIAPTLAVGERLAPATGARNSLLSAGTISIHTPGGR